MIGTRDTNGTATAGNGGGLDPREAATLLDQARRQAQRQFEASPPLLWLIQAVVIFAAYGAMWLSLRGQHPYTGPTTVAIIAVYALVIVSVSATVRVSRRARAGVSGKSRRQRRAGIAALVVADTAVYVFMGALRNAGVSHAIVYSVYPATAPLIVLGAVIAGTSAIREDWAVFGTALAVVTVGAVSAFAGPVNVWAVGGVGLFTVLLGHAGARAWLHRT